MSICISTEDRSSILGERWEDRKPGGILWTKKRGERGKLTSRFAIGQRNSEHHLFLFFNSIYSALLARNDRRHVEGVTVQS